MFCFEKISLHHVLVLFDTLNTSSLLNKEMIKKKFLRRGLYFDDTVEFIKELGLITFEGEHIALTEKYNTCRSSKLSDGDAIKNFIVNCLFRDGTSFSEYLIDFCSHFVLINDCYQFAPLSPQRIYYSAIRNFLIELGVIALDSSDKKYVVTSSFRSTFENFINNKRLSKSDFEVIQHRQKEIGDAAELKIVEYEKQRLSNYPFLSERIEHIAKYDIKAGYDIKSYEEVGQNDRIVPRYIEVKAVSISNSRFFWSRNEIEKSEFYRNLYYLYLLPVRDNDEFDLKGLLVINDPFINVFSNKKAWSRTFESLVFSLISDTKNNFQKIFQNAGPFESYLID